MRRVMVIAGALALTGCTTAQDAANSLAKRWIGHNTDEFFTRYGPPIGRMTLNSGDYMYSWAKAGSMKVPGTAYTNGYMSGNTFNATTTIDPSSDIDMSCTVQLIARPDGAIYRVIVTHDGLGMWEMSRCNEIFG